MLGKVIWEVQLSQSRKLSLDKPIKLAEKRKKGVQGAKHPELLFTHFRPSLIRGGDGEWLKIYTNRKTWYG
jgi:hypothetical protein